VAGRITHPATTTPEPPAVALVENGEPGCARAVLGSRSAGGRGPGDSQAGSSMNGRAN
jgi:hypothetical protein